MLKKVALVTGASGFVGKPLCLKLLEMGLKVRALVRNEAPPDSGHNPDLEYLIVGDLCEFQDWKKALVNVDCIYHCAAKTHDMGTKGYEALEEFEKINVGVTNELARNAAEAGVRRLVFVSSVKVNGEATESGEYFYPNSIAKPEDSYGLTKWRAEQVLNGVRLKYKLEVVIVRPVLIYGPGAKGNLNRLCNLISKKIPLPLGGINNRRSFVGIRNLIDLLIVCGSHERASGEVFFASDSLPLSTTDLVKKISGVLGVPQRLFFVPGVILAGSAKLLNRSHEVSRLTKSLVVDISKNQKLLGWSPMYSSDDELKAMIEPKA